METRSKTMSGLLYDKKIIFRWVWPDMVGFKDMEVQTLSPDECFNGTCRGGSYIPGAFADMSEPMQTFL